jgi:branched-chain amino acid transport system ATP-binding protein
VGRRFGGLYAVRDVSLEVTPGERRAILGPNGAGKTTLFNVVAGDFLPTTGRILLFGEDITRMRAPRRTRRGLTRTYQNALLLTGLTVADNLYLAVRGVRGRRMSPVRPRKGDQELDEAAAVAERVGLKDVMQRRVSELSHGQQRQLELGMALAGRPRLLMLDEPAAGLSPGERASLTRLLLGMDPRLTVLLIEHDMTVALRIAQQVTIMHAGRVIAEGSPAEIQANRRVHDLYLGAHVD